MNTLNEIANKYLKENGIMNSCFAEYIGCEYTNCCKWLKGTRKLNPKQIKKVHEFLAGDFLKPVDEIMKMKEE